MWLMAMKCKASSQKLNWKIGGFPSGRSQKAQNIFVERSRLFHVRQMCRLLEDHEFTPYNGGVEFSRLRRWGGFVQCTSKDEGWGMDGGNHFSQVGVAQGSTRTDVPYGAGRLNHLADLSHCLGMLLAEPLAEEA